MKSYSLSVIVPCYNEEKNIPELVERLQAVFEKKKIEGEIVLVNDASLDGTGKVIARLAEAQPNIKRFDHRKNRGMEAAWRTGLSISSGEYVCLIDADLQNLPEDVWRLYREILFHHSDVVQGFRSHVGRLKDSRFILSKGLNLLLNGLFNMHQQDNKSGFIVCRREVLHDILTHRFRYRYFQTFITVAAKSKGYTIREIETLFESRLVGKSFMPQFPVKVVFFVLLDLVKALVEYRLYPMRESITQKILEEYKPEEKYKTLTGWKYLYFKIYLMLMSLHHWLISGQAGVYYKELKKSQWLAPEQVKRLQEEKLRALIHQAYYHVPYYRETFDRLGLSPSDVKSLEDLQKLPLLEKEAVRKNLYFDLMSDNHDKKKILKISTSGSTGEPFVCFADKHQLEIRWAATQRSMEWTGYRFGDPQTRLWHQTLGMTRLQVMREALDAWFNRRQFIPAYEMSEENLPATIEAIRKHKPVLIDGYAESFNFLALYMKGNHVGGIQPKGIISSAQDLTESSKKIIEEQFGCRVFDKYGSREFSGIAYECEAHAGHHVVAESYILEIIKDGRPAKPGETGEVVITDLHNYCMPLIRYRIGDLAVAMDRNDLCPCGRGLPRVGKIEGRVQAIILGTNGRYLPGTFFSHFFKEYDYIIRQYQVIQETQGKLTLKIIKTNRFDETVFEEIIKQLRQYVGEAMEITTEFVEHIPLVRTGKHQGTISQLQIDFQTIEAQPH